MDKSAVFSWRGSASTIAVVCGAAVGAAGSALWTRLHDAAAQRPAADAPVNVVRAPAEPASDHASAGACMTCAMGAPGGGQ
jgi:hypothetical protein